MMDKYEIEPSCISRSTSFWQFEQNEGRNPGKRSKGRISAKGRKDAAKPYLENSIKLLQNQFENLDL